MKKFDIIFFAILFIIVIALIVFVLPYINYRQGKTIVQHDKTNNVYNYYDDEECTYGQYFTMFYKSFFSADYEIAKNENEQ